MYDSLTSHGQERSAFRSTFWTEIRQAQALPSSQRIQAFGTILARYWRPLYSYFCCKGHSVHDAEELVQQLTIHLMEGDRLATVDQHNGRFRDWLLACAQNFRLDKAKRDNAGKRRPPSGIASLDQLGSSDDKKTFEPAAGSNGEDAFHSAWRRDLLDRAMRAVEIECERDAREKELLVFTEYYLSTASPRPTWNDLAKRHCLANWKEAARMGENMRRRLARAIRAEIAQYVDSEEEINEELCDLLRLI